MTDDNRLALLRERSAKLKEIYNYPRGHIIRYDVEQLLAEAQLAMTRGSKAIPISPTMLYRLCEKLLSMADVLGK